MLEKAKIIVQQTGEIIPVMYNPTELSLNKSVVLQGEGSNIQFQRVNNDDLVVSLFFDSFETKTDVRRFTDRIAALTKPTVGTGVRKEPPTVVFAWSGALFSGVVLHLEQKFTLFLSSGIPVRAELTVTFKSVLTEQEDLESRGYFNCRRLWTVAENDRLYLIAAQTLGDPALWRLIADANQIYNPLDFPTATDIGKTLVIIDIHSESYNPPVEV
ncbi:peptidoglycan-binding protein LysM [Chitinimonas arctica]|uniref:Peptidoglycan-binding protein LysM n=1 Tax=Chitinimonas arctica TaxID=2594795 RepID=A0A516SIM7_9NEIS|nr:peptidoglycan-binding protein LysM [Chitinimonas arctica]QDQ28002.1 peptidoglycan-binding protein LysM [Chitinimonas arctica]